MDDTQPDEVAAKGCCKCIPNGIRWVKGISAGVDEMYEAKKFGASGTQFMIFMTAMYLGIRGFMDSSQFASVTPLMMSVGISSEDGGMITSTMRLPWSLKCIFAMISDIQPIFFYKKVPYMLVLSVAGSVCLFLLALLPNATLAGADGLGLVILLLLLVVNTMASLNDCLTQGKYTEVIKAKGSGILVFRSTMMNTASTCVNLYAGFILDVQPRWLMLSAAPWAVAIIIPIALNMVGDERLERPCSTDCDLVRKQKSIFILAVVMGITVSINIAFAFTPFRVTRIIVTNTCVLGLLALAFFTIDRRIAKINVYLYLCRLCTFGISFQLTQFYTTDPTTCPNPTLNIPGFPFVITQTVGGLMTSGAIFIGLYLFENYLVYWNAQKAFWVTTAFQVIAGCFDIMNTTRFNQRVLGWTGLGNVELRVSGREFRADDLATFLFGSTFLEPLIDQLDSLPSTLLLSKLCPPGIETTMFAILAGYSNIGLSLSGQIGAFVLSEFGFNFQTRQVRDGVETRPVRCEMGGPNSGDPTSFHGMARGLLIGNIILPFLTIPLTWIFIPNKPLNEEFLPDEGDPAAIELQGGVNNQEAGSSFSAGPSAVPLAQGSRGMSFNPGASFDPDLLRHSRSDIMSGGGRLI